MSNEHYYYYMGFVDEAHLGPGEMSSSSGAAAHMQRGQFPRESGPAAPA